MGITTETNRHGKGITMKTSKMMVAVMAIVMMTGFAISAATAQEAKPQKILIDDFSADKWSFSLGREFRGAKGHKELSKTEFVSAPSAMCVDYDFTEGGAYVGINKNIKIPEQVKHVSFKAKITGKNRVFMRIEDASGQVHKTSAIALEDADKWQDITVNLDKKTFRHHWGGAKDGKIHWPLKSLFIAPEKAENKKGKLYVDDLAFLVQGEWRTVKFPNFDILAGDVELLGTPSWTGYIFTLTNTGKTDIEAKVELVDAPNGHASLALPWRRGKGQEDILNTAGPGSKFTHLKKLTIPAGKSVSCSFPINCPNWNPYNRYPLTCRLTASDQVSTQTREILGAKSKGVLLGQARNSKEIKESSIGVVYPWEHGALPKCLPMVAEAGIKWNRGSVRWFKMEKTEHGGKPVGLHPRSIKYLENLKANGINLIETRGIGYDNAEAAYTYWKGAAEVLKPYGINHFELGNEPNGHMPKKWGGNWNGVTDDMEIAPWIYKFVEFVNAAAKGIKEVHPDAVVIAGAGLHSTARRAIQVGFSKDVDGVSDHPYPYSVTPELIPWGGEHCLKRDGFVSADDDHTFLSQMRRLKEEAIKAGRPDFQIWLTEWGIPVFQYHGKTALTQKEMNKLSFNVIEMGAKRLFIYEGHTENTQAKYLARRLIETLSIPDIVTKNFYFCFNRGPWFDKRHPEKGGFSLTRTQDAAPRPSYYAMQRITGLFSDGVKPIDLKIGVPLDRKQGRTGAAWERPYGSNPALWEGVVPMNELTTPRKYAFTTPEGELMIAVWMPVRAEDWREPDFCNITIGTTDYENPIAIDILTGERTDLEWSEKTENGVTVLKNVTVPDYPIVIKMFPKKQPSRASLVDAHNVKKRKNR